jgi:hypothetical protein
MLAINRLVFILPRLSYCGMLHASYRIGSAYLHALQSHGSFTGRASSRNRRPTLANQSSVTKGGLYHKVNFLVAGKLIYMPRRAVARALWDAGRSKVLSRHVADAAGRPRSSPSTFLRSILGEQNLLELLPQDAKEDPLQAVGKDLRFQSPEHEPPDPGLGQDVPDHLPVR